MSGKTMRVLVLVVGLTMAGCQAWNDTSGNTTPDKRAQTRSEINTVASDTLTRLDSLRPGSRRTVENAAGYAVFSNYGVQLFVAGGGAGSGVAVNNRTKSQTFMKMVQGQAGFGLGARKIQLVWVFDSEQKLNDFINKGWTLGGQGSASAALDKEGAGLEGAVPVASGVWLYQLTDTGLALELTVQGSKYYKDADLN